MQFFLVYLNTRTYITFYVQFTDGKPECIILNITYPERWSFPLQHGVLFDPETVTFNSSREMEIFLMFYCRFGQLSVAKWPRPQIFKIPQWFLLQSDNQSTAITIFASYLFILIPSPTLFFLLQQHQFSLRLFWWNTGSTSVKVTSTKIIVAKMAISQLFGCYGEQ